MSTLTLGVVIGAGLQGAFGTVFKKASGEVNTLGQAIKDLRKQESAVQSVPRTRGDDNHRSLHRGEGLSVLLDHHKVLKKKLTSKR